MSKFLISIVGPTAIGKTTLSIALAEHYNTEILSADSRQFYKEMSIGTAVPSETELTQAKHNFIHHKSITETYSVGDFERDASKCLNQIFEKNDIAILVGGSGLYVNAVTVGLDDFPEIDQNIRKELNNRLNTKGLNNLVEELKIKDPLSFEAIAIDNPRRVIRALEVCLQTGKPYSSYLGKRRNKESTFKTTTIGLKANRETIYDRINKRVDEMIANGLIQEANSIYSFKHLNALNTVGYKEIFEYFDGKITLDQAIEEIKKNTRRFAKRQLTWFNKDKSINWFDYNVEPDVIINLIDQEMKKPH